MKYFKLNFIKKFNYFLKNKKKKINKKKIKKNQKNINIKYLKLNYIKKYNY